MKKSLLVFLMQIVATGAFFVATLIVARYLGPEAFGDFSAAYSVAIVAYIICLLGADITAVNVVSMSLSSRQTGQVKAFILYVFVIVLVLTTFYFIVAGIGYWVLGI